MDLIIKEKYVLSCVHNCVDGIVKRHIVDPITGVATWHDLECTCNQGWVSEKFVVADDIIDKLNDIIDKCNDIFEKVNE